MFCENREFRHLSMVIGQVKAHLDVMGHDLGPLNWWFENRFAPAEAELAGLVRSSQVAAFVSDYSASLRRSLEQLMSSNAWDVLAEIPMDYVEELVLQARSCSEMMAGQAAPAVAEHEVLMESSMPDSDLASRAVNQELAAAA